MGADKTVKSRSIIGIFDLDTSTVKKTTRNFLKSNEKSKKIDTLSSEIPRSFIVCEDKTEENVKFKVYLSPMNSTTLIKTKSN